MCLEDFVRLLDCRVLCPECTLGSQVGGGVVVSSLFGSPQESALRCASCGGLVLPCISDPSPGFRFSPCIRANKGDVSCRS